MKPTTATVQPLERRVLLSTFNPDPSFGDGGFARAVFTGARTFQASLVAEVNPQTILVVGQLDHVGSEGRRLAMAQFDADTGALNEQFGTGGRVTSIRVNSIYDAEYLSDGKLLIVAELDRSYFLARLTPSGDLDPTFSGDGVAELNFASFGGAEGFFEPAGLAVAPDGKAVVSGRIGSQVMPLNETLLARFTTAGQLDATFDGDGVAVFNNNANLLGKMAVQNDGKILLPQGATVRRFTASGAIDATFGQNGAANFPDTHIHSIHPLPDGRILTNYGQDRIARITANGELDASFGEDGTAPMVSGVNTDNRVNFYIAPDGRITVVSIRGASRFLADGQPDPTFGIRGQVNNPSTDLVGTHAILATDGDILMSGYINETPGIVLGRFTPQTEDVFLEAGGRLIITGTVDADTITVDVTGDQVRLDLNGEIRTFPLADVTKIRIDTDHGDDVITVNVPLMNFDIDSGPGNDSITSTGGGNDTVSAGDGNDTIVTGDGSDSINAGDGNDSVSSGGGNDTIGASIGDNVVDAGAGDDLVRGGAGNNSIMGGDGDDYLEGGINNDTLIGGAGNDTLRPGRGDNLCDGGDGDDFIKAGEGNDTIHGGDGNDRIYAGDGNNLVFAGAGDDYIQAGSGADTIWGEIGYDTVKAGDGDDYINGGAGKDRLFGQQGNDTIYAGRADDALDGGPGMDLLKGGDGNDKLWDRDGFADRLFGGLGEDIGLWDEDLDEILEVESLL